VTRHQAVSIAWVSRSSISRNRSYVSSVETPGCLAPKLPTSEEETSMMSCFHAGKPSGRMATQYISTTAPETLAWPLPLEAFVLFSHGWIPTPALRLKKVPNRSLANAERLPREHHTLDRSHSISTDTVGPPKLSSLHF